MSTNPLPVEPARSSMDLVREAETIAAISTMSGVASAQDMAPRLVRLVCDTMVVLLGKMEHIEDMAAVENELEIKEVAEGYLEKRVSAELKELYDRFEKLERRLGGVEGKVRGITNSLRTPEAQVDDEDPHAG
jgi:flagellar motility protein MotE (MotC chaperone)